MNRATEKVSDDQSEEKSVLVPFEAKWQRQLAENCIRGVLRKRVPKERSYEWIYIYMNAPISAVCFRGRLEHVVDITKESAFEKASAICLSEHEITRYFGNRESVGYYAIQQIEVAQTPVTLAQLSRLLHLHPPQGFLILSSVAKSVIDSNANFMLPTKLANGQRVK